MLFQNGNLVIVSKRQYFCKKCQCYHQSESDIGYGHRRYSSGIQVTHTRW